MPVDKSQAQMLATLAIACRPHGAPRWDEAGVLAVLAKVRHLALADVTHAVIRAAEDREARTPGVIGVTTSPCWRDRDPARPVPIEKVSGAELCDLCGKSLLRHNAPDHVFVAQGEYLAHRSLPDPQRHTAAALKALAACETDESEGQPTEHEESHV